MNEPWFDPNLWAWIPGTVLGTLGGLWGGLVGALAPRGLGKAVVWGVFWVLIGGGLACLAGGVVALATGQPYGVWYGLLLPGLLIPGLVGALGRGPVRQRYREAELRRMEAADIS